MASWYGSNTINHIMEYGDNIAMIVRKERLGGIMSDKERRSYAWISIIMKTRKSRGEEFTGKTSEDERGPNHQWVKILYV